MSGSFTPGPWTVDGLHVPVFYISAPGRDARQIVARVPRVIGYRDDPGPEAEANARLIAAAPALAQSLQEMVALFLADGSISTFSLTEAEKAVLYRAKVALRQATGEEVAHASQP